MKMIFIIGLVVGGVQARAGQPAYPVNAVPELPAHTSYGGPAAVFADKLFFSAGSGTEYQLLAADGTEQGARIVQGASAPEQLTPFGDRLFFVGRDPAHGREIWWTDADASAATVLADFASGPADFDADRLTTSASKLFFVAGKHLWASDGTAEGTGPISIPETSDYWWAGMLAASDQGVYFAVTAPTPCEGAAPCDTELYFSDGTSSGTRSILNLTGLSFDIIAASSQGVYLGVRPLERLDRCRHEPIEVYFSDGTGPGTKSIWRGQGFCNPVLVGEQFYFHDGSHLYQTDSTEQRRHTVAELNPLGAQVRWMAGIGETLVYLVQWTDDVRRTITDVWRSDGTEEGTYLLLSGRDLPDDLPWAGVIPSWVEAHGVLFFNLPSGAVWITDGTQQGTSLLEGLVAQRLLKAGRDPILFSSYEQECRTSTDLTFVKDAARPADSMMLNLPGSVRESFDVFATSRGVFTRVQELDSPALFWIDRSKEGATELRLPTPSPKPPVLSPVGTPTTGLVTFRGKVFFGAIHDAVNAGLWRTDGTISGTVLVWRRPDSRWAVTGLAPAGDQRLLFIAELTCEPNRLRELWSTDGTRAGTMLLSYASLLDRVGPLVLFNDSMDFNPGRSSIWATDGTTPGTRLVAAGHGLGFFGDREVAAAPGGTPLVFPADGLALWRTDGTAIGTRLVSTARYPHDLVLLGDSVYCLASRQAEERVDLWRIDTGTWTISILRDVGYLYPHRGFLTVVGGRLLFVVRGENAWELWSSDGSSQDMVLVRELRAVLTGNPAFNDSYTLVGTNKEGAFACFRGITNDLWVTDGTTGGTVLLRQDLAFPSSIYSPCEPAGCTQSMSAGNDLYFVAEGGLWSTDGTPAGTVLVHPFEVNASLGYPNYLRAGGSSPFAVAGSRLFFQAPDLSFPAQRRLALWALPLEELSVPFHRGDENNDGTTDISDAITTLGFLFLGTPAALSCRESADSNNDGTIDISDGVYLLSWLFTGGPAPAPPGPTGAPCGTDPDAPGSAGDLGCESYSACQ